MVVKELQSAKIYAILLVSVMLVGALSLSLAISSLMNDVIIGSSGRIVTPTIASIAYESEIRGVFVHSMSMVNPDWDLIAQTCADYDINLVLIEATGNDYGHYASDIIPHGSEELAPAIAACHARGIELHVAMNVMLSAYEGDGQERRVVIDDGTTANWLCPTKQTSRDLLKALVEEIVTNYDIDGFMFDYIRYATREMCFCPDCEAAFKADTGLTDAVFPTDVLESGKYSKEFVEWRIKPITELVRDMRSWMLAIKPDLRFSEGAFTLFEEAPTYWRYWIGQDTADWVRNDYLDFVAPMIFTDDLATTESQVRANLNYMTGGPEGKIPLIPVLDTCVDAVSTPDNVKQRVDKIRELGCDGWLIWRYGGPGDGEGSNAPDIRNYLSIVDMPNIFTLGDMAVSATKEQATITWKTTLPTTSKVEYSNTPLFPAFFRHHAVVDFNYWDIDHVAGTLIENNTLVINHKITLTDLLPETKYYFRVQSEGSGGTATSKVLTFTTES